MNSREHSPIFIMSSERSGSNLLRSLLSNHSGLAGPISPHLLDSFWWIIEYYGNLKKKEHARTLFNDMLSVANHPYHNWELQLDFDMAYAQYHPQSFLDLVDLFYFEYAKSQGKPRIVCKEIHLFHHVFPLLSYYQDKMKLLYLYRDPRDYVASWMKNKLFLKTPYNAIVNWVREQQSYDILINTHNVNVYFVKYEELISDTPQIMRGILDFINEAVEEACFNTDLQKNQQVSWNPYWKNLTRPVMNNNQKKYRTLFDSNTICMLETIAKKSMLQLGYEFETNADWQETRLFRLKNWLSSKYYTQKLRSQIRVKHELLFSKLELLQTIRTRVLRTAC